MLPETVSKRLKALPVLSRQGKRINGLFRLMETLALWQQAYAKISANAGATTRGVDHATMDGFSSTRVARIIARLKAGRYRFKPVRRVYIPKANGKRRPLGIPSADDKLVQEVIRLLLERIYEPIFSDQSHGFRPHRSCHTALQAVERWDGVKWLVEVDLQGFYDTMDHDLMIRLLQKKIADRRFITLIKAMLKAGYLEDWTFHHTYSGTPQGGIASPILSNIYLHELDRYMEDMKAAFDKGKRRAENRAYQQYTSRIYRRRKTIQRLMESGHHDSPTILRMKGQIRELDHARKALPSVNLLDAGYRRLSYCRYADDFVIGIIGSKADARQIMRQVREFVQNTLNLGIAEEKSSIRHAKEGTIFLGYELLTRSSDKTVRVKRGQRYTRCRSVSERMRLRIPEERLRKFCHTHEYGHYETLKTVHRPALERRSDVEILLAYNAELRGLANYYSLAYSARSRLQKLYFVWRGSLLKTLAYKHKTTVRHTAHALKHGKSLAQPYEVQGKRHALKVFALRDLKPPSFSGKAIDDQPNVYRFTLNRAEIVQRLNAKLCEYCGRTTGDFEVHHVRKLRDVLDGKALWQHIMAAMRRKTLVLCVECHKLLHRGLLPDVRHGSQREVESRIH